MLLIQAYHQRLALLLLLLAYVLSSRYLQFILEMLVIHSELVDIRAEITVMGGDEYDVEMTVIAGPFSRLP